MLRDNGTEVVQGMGIRCIILAAKEKRVLLKD